MSITATRITTNTAWTKTLCIMLDGTPDNGYWWHGYRADGETAKDAVIDANTLAPGRDRRTGYKTADSATRAAVKAGWSVKQGTHDMKLSLIVDRATISPLTWDYNCLDEAVVAETIVDGDDTYHLVIELDGGHGVWYDGGSAGEPSYLDALAECHEYPEAVEAWLANA